MVNYYSDKSIRRIKDSILSSGGKLENIPYDIFVMAMMLTWGMSRGKADRWIRNYSYTKVIKVMNDKDMGVVVNFI